MDNTPVVLYLCPDCKKPIAEMNIQNNTVQTCAVYSDGVKKGRGEILTPHFSPNFGKCPFCGTVFFLHNLRALDKKMPENKYKYMEALQTSDYITAVEQGYAKTHEEEIELRTCLWRFLNDKIRFRRDQNHRYPDYEKSFFQNETSILWEKNCTSLLSLLEQKYSNIMESAPDDDNDDINELSILMAELNRNLGHFNSCSDILEKLPYRYKWLKQKYLRRIASHDRLVFELMTIDKDEEILGTDDIDLNDPDLAIEYWTKEINERECMLNAYYYHRAEAYFNKGDMESALADINMSLQILSDSEESYYLRSQIYKKLDDDDKARWNLFKSRHIAAFQKVINDKSKKILIEKNEDIYDNPFITKAAVSIQKNEGEILLCLKDCIFENEPLEPEILYSGGENALLRRRPDQFILLENVPDEFFSDSDVREEIFNRKETTITENNLNLTAKISNAEKYKVQVRLVIETLDSIDSIVKSGYPIYTSLRARINANMDKPIADIIGREDFINLAAVLAREENYNLLEKYFAENLPINENTGFSFKTWRPSPLYYVTTNRLIGFLENPPKIIRFLAANGADPDKGSEESDTPLGNQCLENGLALIMKTLIEIGADPNCFTEFDGGPIKPLHLMLLPAEYDEFTKELKPLKTSDIEKIKLLIDNGADVNYLSDSGSTALSLAINNSEGTVRKELIKLLLDKGADIQSAVDALNKGVEQKHSQAAFSLYEIYSGHIEGLSVKLDSALARKYLCISADLLKPAE